MTQEEPNPLDSRRRRLLFRATHRGTQEADLLLGGYVKRTISALPDADLAGLEQLLELPDPDLVDWITGRRPIPAAHDTALLRRIQQAAGG